MSDYFVLELFVVPLQVEVTAFYLPFTPKTDTLIINALQKRNYKRSGIMF